MRTRFVGLKPVAGFAKESIKDGASQHWAPTAHVVSDGLHAFLRLLQISQTGTMHDCHVMGWVGKQRKPPAALGQYPAGQPQDRLARHLSRL